MNAEKEKWIEEMVEPILKKQISLDDLERVYMRRAILFCNGNKRRASRLLQVSRSKIHDRINRHNWLALKGNLVAEDSMQAEVISMSEYRLKREKK